jgi:hypothetical protein
MKIGSMTANQQPQTYSTRKSPEFPEPLYGSSLLIADVA